MANVKCLWVPIEESTNLRHIIDEVKVREESAGRWGGFLKDHQAAADFFDLETVDRVRHKTFEEEIWSLDVSSLPYALKLSKEELWLADMLQYVEGDYKIKRLVRERHFGCIAQNHWTIRSERYKMAVASGDVTVEKDVRCRVRIAPGSDFEYEIRTT